MGYLDSAGRISITPIHPHTKTFGVGVHPRSKMRGILGRCGDKRFLFASFFALAFILGPAPHVYAAAPKSPVILSPKVNERVLTFTPVITGVAENNTRIIVIIDDKIVGSVKTKNGKRGTGTFIFRTKSLKSGSHAAYVLADRGGARSNNSSKTSFTIPKNVVRRLDGVIVPLEKYRSWPVGVMIENLPTVRNNQRGLSEASVVYETLAEGGATRFLALFDGENLKAGRITPIRSVRPYYAQWAREYGAVVMHAGGSPDGVWEIRRLHLQDADYLKGKTSKYFWRTDRSQSVHNLATSNVRINKMLADFGRRDDIPDFQSWKFKPQAALASRGKNGSSVVISFGAKAFQVEYRYNRLKNMYERWNGSIPHRDANTKKQLAAKNVIVQYVPKEKVLDRKGRLEIKTTGSGSGLLMQDGKFLTVRWTKKTSSSRTIFRYTNGKEIELNGGPIWIEVVPRGKTVTLRK